MTLYVLSFGTLRTGQLLRSMPGISKKMLAQTLRELEGQGLVVRTVVHVMPPMVEYTLSGLGRRFVEPLLALYDWAEANAALLDAVDHNRGIASAGHAASGTTQPACTVHVDLPPGPADPHGDAAIFGESPT
jgi:DNA-binding HxlR family transcriptional regulator